MNLEELARLKRGITKLSSAAEQAKGGLKETMKLLNDEFGVASLKEAFTQLAVMKTDSDEASEDLDKAHEEFMEEWGDVLE